MNELVPFILVYFAADASPSPQPSAGLSAAGPKRPDLTASEIRMNPDGAIQYLKFHDVSYNLTDFTICTWIQLANFSHTQTIFRLTGNKKETVMSWQVDARPKETMTVTIRNRLVASETTRLAAGGRWNHVCFQWKDSTGVWAIFVNAKIHSVGQTPAADDNTAAASSGLHGKGAGIVGDDGAPCRNGWRVYGLYMTGPAACCTAKTKKTDKRQAVYESDSDDPAGGAAVPKPFQWFTRTFAFVKRAFTFVIIPFFKFVRNTFFQTRSMDDTVVDVSETHMTVSDVKFAPPAATTTTTTTTTAAATTAAATTAAATTAAATMATTAANTTVAESVDDDSAEEDDRGATERRRSSKREATGKGERCAATGRGRTDGRVAVSDLLPAGVPALTPDAARYLRTVSEGLNDVGVNAAFARRTFACCRPAKLERPVAVDWDSGRYTAHDVIASPHVCGSG